MLQKIIAFSVKQKLLVALGVVALIVTGVYQLTKLPIDAVPDITDNQVQLITVAPSLGATDIERLVTAPVEQICRNIPGLKNMRSFSRFGLSIVTLVFEEDVDVYWARQQVSERLVVINAQIPKGVGQPQMAPITTGLGEIYQYVLRPAEGYEKQWTPTELRTLQDWFVRKQLLGVKGVADVSSYGGYQKQFQVTLNPNKLQSAGVGVNEVFDALSKENANTGGSYIEKGPQALFVRTEGLLTNAAEIGSVVVKLGSGGLPILVKDVATIAEGSATRYGAMCYNADGEVAGAVVMMLKGANSNEVVGAVKERVAAIQKQLPKGVVMEAFLDRTKMVDNAIGTVEKNLAEGALIVVLVLVLALGSLRAGFVVASVIPLAMLFAIIMMNLFGVSGNLMSLGALDFGLIIDGAVIIVEAILHQLWKKDHQGAIVKDRDQVVVQNAGRMMNSAVFGQLIILVVYLPIFSLEGIEGKMFKPMAQTVAFALVGAFILSLTYIPMMCSYFLPLHPSKGQERSENIVKKIEKAFEPLLRWAVGKARLIVISSAALLLISLVAFSTIGGEFIPELEEGDFAVETRIMTGSSVKASIDYTQQAAKILLDRFPEVEKVVTKIGNGEIPTDPMPMEASDMMVILKDKKDWVSAETFEALAEKMSAALEEVPGVTVGFQFPVQMRFNELMTGAKQDVVCKIYGANMDSLSKLAVQLGAIASNVEGAKDVYVEQVGGQPQVVVKYNRGKMALHGIRTETLNQALETAFAGATAGQIYEDEKRFDLVVRLDAKHRSNQDDVSELPIKTESGQLIPLKELATVSVIDGPNQIQRENAQRRITVGFNVRGADVQTVVEALQSKVNKQMRMPAGYSLHYGGSFENLQSAKSRLAIAIPAALLLIWMLLYFAFSSVQYSLIIFSAIPLSLIGGIWGLLLRDMPFSISAGIGMIALFGVAVLNGIVLLAEFRRHPSPTNLQELKEQVVQSTLTRLRPVLMTALVAALGFMPMALSHGAGAEVQKPLATVVIGGLITATLLTLLLLPTLYIALERRKFKFANAKTLGVLLVLCASLFGNSLQAQTNQAFPKFLTLEQVLDSAVQHNKQLHQYRFLAASAEKQALNKLSLDPMAITLERGQVNSWYQDQKLGASQAIAMPQYYRAEYRNRKSMSDVMRYRYGMKELEIKQSVAMLFHHLQHTREQFALWHNLDSMAKLNLEKMSLRLLQGDVDALELNDAKKVAADVNMRYKQLLQLYESDALELGAWMGLSVKVYPAADAQNLAAPVSGGAMVQGTLNLLNLPAQRLAEANTAMSYQAWQLARAQRLPYFQIGWVQQSFQGYQQLPAGERYFGREMQFSQYQLGLRVPVVGGGYRRRAEGLRMEYQAAAMAEQFVGERANLRYEQLKMALAFWDGQIQQYHDVLLPAANEQLRLLGLRRDKGEISGLAWGVYLRDAMQTQIDYYQTVHEWESVQLELQYFNPNIQ